MAPPEESPAESRALKILEFTAAEVVVVQENLEIVCKNLRMSGAELVSVIAVMGPYRSGKSFLLDLILRYLKSGVPLPREAKREPEETGEKQPWCFGDEDPRNTAAPPAWFVQADPARISEGSTAEGFAWRPGPDKCTHGTWLRSHPFVYTNKEGQRVAVLLMDTQGAWDDSMTQAQTSTIFGMTALLSSKLIYNIQNKIEEDKLSHLDYITTLAQTVCNDVGRENPFGHIEFLIRDWPNYEDGFTLDQCRKQMAGHMDKHLNPKRVPEDAVEKVERLKSVFETMNCFGLPHPGLKVTKPTYQGEIAAIDSDFIHLLDEFIDSFFREDFLRPSAPLGCELTVHNFRQIVTNFAEIFQTSQPKAMNLRDAFVKVELLQYQEAALDGLRRHIAMLAPEHAVVSPHSLAEAIGKVRRQALEDYTAKLAILRVPEGEYADFKDKIRQVADYRIDENNKEMEGATVKLAATPIVGCTAYFLLVHHWLLVFLACGGGWAHMKKWSKRKNVGMVDVGVFHGIYQDVQKWSAQRWKDVQAIEIALQSLNPGDMLEMLGRRSQDVVAISSAALTTLQGQVSKS